jgi:hypothetical protein
MLRPFLLMILLAAMAVGCTPKDYPAVDIDAAKAIQSGTPLEEITKSLGEPHPPTARQANHLENVVAKMPEQIRANAKKDKSLAWGNDAQFLVVKVNEKGVAWVTSWSSGNP